ncbi:MAG: flagellar protein FlaG [Lachnospiraceae bacterium]|nr:flagellar protein FlaG [Lachnospiraceae bacterium]
MTVEPMNSAMTFMAQPTQAARPVTPLENVNTEVASQENAANLDQTTAKVAEAEGYDPDAKGGESKQQELTDEQAQAQNEKIKKAVEELNKKMADSEAVYGIHDGTNRVTIKIVDKKTHETLKELPPEKTLDMIAKVWEMAGILVDEKR